MSEIKFVSTRGDKREVTASEAIVKGIATDGGLYVPTTIPAIDFNIEEMTTYTYQELAYRVLRLLLTDYTEEELKFCIEHAYDEKFDTKLIAPLATPNGHYILELFHGKTLAFKDMALSILPYLLKIAAKKNGVEKEIVILTATSGDTGKAALEGFADVEGTKIIVFYPEDGVSDVQKMQMATQTGKNTCVAAIKGNFDDAQTAVKKIFTDKDLAKQLDDAGYVFSSANSINIGRLAPQIVYYFYAYAQMVRQNHITCGEKVSFTVPTGNFGNILAGFYAKQMGLPIDTLLCASNDNKILYDFFHSGAYDTNREFILTASPSMDILISSNLERLLYHLSDAERTNKSMSFLNKDGKYEFDDKFTGFASEYATQAETLAAIKELYTQSGYIMDTHTAVAYASYEKYAQATPNATKNIIVSTASPYKFAKDVCIAIDEQYTDVDAFAALNVLEELQKSIIPEPIRDIDKKEVLHKTVLEKDGLKAFVIQYLR